MTYNIDLKEGGHVWGKENLTTIITRNGSYDILKCKHCGIQGKTSSLWTIKLKGSYSKEKVYNCPHNQTAKRIKITLCTAMGKVFSNLTPGSEHNVIAPPEAYANDKGTWIMGVGEPVKVLPNEFIAI
jgi:hypothetical protein